MPSVPMPPTTREYPFVRNPDHSATSATKGFKRLTIAVLQALLGVGELGHVRRSNQDSGSVSLKLRPSGGLEVRLAGGELRTLECGKVRASCRCAHCVDEFTH